MDSNGEVDDDDKGGGTDGDKDGDKDGDDDERGMVEGWFSTSVVSHVSPPVSTLATSDVKAGADAESAKRGGDAGGRGAKHVRVAAFNR